MLVAYCDYPNCTQHAIVQFPASSIYLTSKYFCRAHALTTLDEWITKSSPFYDVSGPTTREAYGEYFNVFILPGQGKPRP